MHHIDKLQYCWHLHSTRNKLYMISHAFVIGFSHNYLLLWVARVHNVNSHFCQQKEVMAHADFWVQQGQKKRIPLKWKKESETRVLITELTQAQHITNMNYSSIRTSIEILRLLCSQPDIIFKAGFICAKNTAAFQSTCKSDHWFMQRQTSGWNTKFNFWEKSYNYLNTQGWHCELCISHQQIHYSFHFKNCCIWMKHLSFVKAILWKKIFLLKMSAQFRYPHPMPLIWLENGCMCMS